MSAKSHSVTVLATHTLRCASKIPSPSTHKLGPLDQLVSPSIPTAIVFVYRQFSKEPIVIERLQRALALVLDYYPHLTGRLQINPDGTLEITRLGTGAELLTAQCSERLDEFSSQGRILVTDLPGAGNSLLAPYDPSLEAVCRNPLFTIQHTRFSCGGVSLGVRLPHVICDGDGFFQFVRNLAELYRGLKLHDSPRLARLPNFRSYLSDKMTPEERQVALEFRPSLFHIEPEKPSGEANAGEDAPTNPKEPQPPPPAVGRVLRFSSLELEALKAHATDPNGGAWVSTFDALAAVLYQSVYQARVQYYAEDLSVLSPPDFLTPINFRTRLSDIPPDYFPDALICTYTSLPHEVLVHGPLWQVAKHLHDLTRSAPDAEQATQTVRWLAAQPDKRRIAQGFRYGSGSLMLSQWTKFDMYAGTEFEEKPVLVSLPFTPITLLDGLGYFLPTEALGPLGGDKGAIDVNLSLSEPIWEILGRNEQLRRFSSLLSDVEIRSE